jgi:hypothetical protein
MDNLSDHITTNMFSTIKMFMDSFMDTLSMNIQSTHGQLHGHFVHEQIVNDMHGYDIHAINIDMMSMF